MKITKSQTVTIQLLAFLFLPGVIIHELSHAFVASILFVRVGDIEFFPQVKGDSVKLGSVEVAHTDPFRRALIGIAPVFIGISLIFSALFYFTQPSLSGTIEIWKLALLLYTLFEISNTMFSSSKDLEGTIEVVGALVVICILVYFVGGVQVLIPFVTQYFLSSALIQLFQLGSVYLTVPIGIDVALLAIAKGLIRRE